MKEREGKATGDEYHEQGSERQIVGGVLVWQALGKALAEAGDGSVVETRRILLLREEEEEAERVRLPNHGALLFQC